MGEYTVALSIVDMHALHCSDLVIVIESALSTNDRVGMSVSLSCSFT